MKSLINEQGGHVVFLVLSEYSFVRDFRVLENRQNDLEKNIYKHIFF